MKETHPSFHAPTAHTRLSRRTFVGLAAATTLAGCAPVRIAGDTGGSSATPAATRPPTPIAPSGSISVANASSMKRLATFTPNAPPVRGVAWSGDGRLLAAGADPDIYLWDMTNPAFRAIWRGHTAQIFDMAWSPDGKHVASASVDGSVRLWVSGQTQAETVLDADGTSPISVSWAPDSSRVACGTIEGYTFIWNAATGARLAKWSGPPMVGRGKGGRYPFAVWGVSWSPDGRTIATTRYDGYIQLWDVASGHATVWTKPGFQPNTVAWSPSGDVFAISDDVGAVQIWHAATGKVGATLFNNDTEAGWAYALAWSPDGQLIGVTRETGLIQVWSVADAKRLASLQGHDTSSWALGWSPNDLRIASGGDDGKVCLWGV